MPKSSPISSADYLSLETLRRGDVLHILTEGDGQAYSYSFTVADRGEAPLGTLVETLPEGTPGPDANFRLEGAGNWTDRDQNPVQTQSRAFTPAWGEVYVGGLLFGTLADAEPRERLNLVRPITRLALNAELSS